MLCELALTIFRLYPATLEIARVVMRQRCNIEFLEHAVAALLPVFALEQHEEVIPADVSDEIGFRPRDFLQQFADQLDHLVAPTEAVDVVIWLEMIDIEVASGEFDAFFQQAVDVFVDGHIARQLSKRVGIACRGNLHLRDLA